MAKSVLSFQRPAICNTFLNAPDIAVGGQHEFELRALAA
jgi:hypothetical protein